MPAPTAHDVRSVRFVATKFREGYEPAEVDALLERIATTLDDLAAGRAEASTLTADDVLNARFRATKFRDGYDQDQVDDFLDTVVLALRARRTPVPAERTAATGMLAAAAAQGGGWVRTALDGLTRVRLSRGYAPADVDEILGRVATELDRRLRGEQRRMTARDVRDAPIPATWWRPGYGQTAVDTLLDEVAVALGD